MGKTLVPPSKKLVSQGAPASVEASRVAGEESGRGCAGIRMGLNDAGGVS